MRIPTLLCALLLVAGCGKKEPSTALAKVGSVEITAADLDAEIARRVAAKRPVGSATDLLEEMIREEVLVQQAEKAGLADEPELRRTYRQMLIGQLKEQQLRKDLAGLTIDDSAIVAYYETNRDRYAIPARARLALIQIKGDATRAQEVHTAVANGADFAKLAAANSDHQASRYRGGDIGWVAEGAKHRLPAEVIEAGAHSEAAILVNTAGSHYIVQRTAREEGGHRPLVEVTPAIRSELLRTARAELAENFYASMEAKGDVVRFKAPDEAPAMTAPFTEPEFPSFSATTISR